MSPLLYILTLGLPLLSGASSPSVQPDLSADTLSAAKQACAALRQTLGPSIVASSGPEYTHTAADTWSLFNSRTHPTCIVYPRTSTHVQAAMASIYQFGSRYSLQSGGHSAMIGWNSITDGVLIAFSHMNSTTYDPRSKTATVQPGVHWGDALDAVQSHGVSVLGGRASDIGTGLLLGGGISFVSPLYGWSSDLIKEMDVVLPTGKMVTASETNAYGDLFQALKVGANRFGIVTRYELYVAETGTKDDKRWYGGIITFPGDQAEAFSNATAKYIRETRDPKAGLISLMNVLPTPANIAYMFYQGSSLPESIFGDFLAIPGASPAFSPLSYYDIEMLIPGNGRGNGNQFGGSAWVGDEATYWAGYQKLQSFAAQYGSKLHGAFLIVSPIPEVQWRASRNGKSLVGNPGVSYGAINYNLVYPAGVSTLPADADAGFQRMLQEAAQSKGLPLYVNECHANQEVFATYEHYNLLKNIYAKYDPSRFITKHMLGPKGL
ncbi:unnamed protein product [Mycena citricolor]|uniref:FAD-binding PCMH-type domain-containing protein n=1 Tax=Mycena citricolor TaxID=2018698 RepID=A0AAD2K8K9_9AGAR|nr:unnamed protein product [Mycena citricolor]